MMYKKTYRLIIVLLMVIIGIFYLKDSLMIQYNNQQNLSLVKQLNLNNQRIELMSSFRLNSLEEGFRKMKEYRELLVAGNEIVDLTKTFTTFIEYKEKELERMNEWNILKNIKNKQALYNDINEQLAQYNHNLLDVFIRLKKNRTLGIRSKEFEMLKERINQYFEEPLNQNYSYILFKIDNHLLQLAKIKNRVLIASNITVTYLSCIIGGGSVTFDRYQVLAWPPKETIKQGEIFEPEISLASAVASIHIQSLKIDGVPIQKNKDERYYIQYNTDRKGKQKYTVEVAVKNPQTKKVDTFKKTYRYTVE